MKIPFSAREISVIEQMAKIMDISPEQVIIQAVRLFQLWKTGKVDMVFPRIVNSKCIVDVPSTEISTDVICDPGNTVEPLQPQ
jgi:hypothetical protein